MWFLLQLFWEHERRLNIEVLDLVHRLVDGRVASASAQVAVQRLKHVCPVEFRGIAGHYEAWSAVAALRSLRECFLYGVGVLGSAEALDSRYMAPVAVAKRNYARVRREVHNLVLVVVKSRDHDDAGTATAFLAHCLGAAEAELVDEVR